MVSLFHTEDFTALELSAEYAEQLQTLCERCADYSEMIEGKPPDSAAAQNLFYALPDGKEYDDKFLIGIFNSDKLIGVLDVIRDYPDKDIWFIGLLMLEPAQRSKSIGTKIMKSLENWVSGLGARQLRLSVAEENTKALNFWRRVGFQETGVKLQKKFGNKEHTMIIMNRSCFGD
jgi:RimJ/RimL family protein N-acetyltransferase